MEQAYAHYKDCTQDKDLIYEALKQEKWERDHVYREKWLEEQATQRGLQKGMEQGLQKGMAQGIQQGLQQGMQQGARNEKYETAKKLKELGLSVSQIIHATELTEEEIQNIT